MITDPARKRRDDTGHPDVCSVYELYRHTSRTSSRASPADCRQAAIGCTDCKDRLAARIAEDLAPFREKRDELSLDPLLAAEILAAGAEKVKPIADATLAKAREAMQHRHSVGVPV